MTRFVVNSARLTLVAAFAASTAVAQVNRPAPAPAGAAALTSPKKFFGFDVGADYQLVNYTKFVEYFQLLAKQSDRMDLDTIGLSEEGRPQIMAIISSPENLRNKEKYRRISEQLSRAEGLTDAQAHQLAKDGKLIFWIDGGLHATEVLGAQQMIETGWQFVSGDDEETRRFRNDCIILIVPANPDGMELVSNWYMRQPDSLLRTTGNIPRLYEKYAGHDNNRDSYMNNLAETRNVSKAMYMQWYPQIMYNHHQTGPAGAVMFAPPFRDPMNYNLHPLMKSGLDYIGAAIAQRAIQEGKGGVTSRTGSSYSTWWNGGFRTAAYFHNQLGILTETIGNPTPGTVPFAPGWQLPSADLMLPVKPGPWHFRQSIEYSVTANKAIADLGSRYRETWLYNIYAMGKDAIAKGNTDTWTMWPRELIAIADSMGSDGRGGRLNGAAAGAGGRGGGGGRGGRGGAAQEERYWAMLHSPETRDPRGYIIPSSQRDFGTATRFIQTLQRTGLDVMRATAAFTVKGKQYPAGSYVVKTNQAFRPMVLDMFEPQDHPDDFAYPGAPPTRPYDNAGWTVAFQMGVDFDRVQDGFDCPCTKLKYTELAAPLARAVPAGGDVYLIDPAQNDAVIAANQLMKENVNVFRTSGGGALPQGTWVIPRGGAADRIISDAATKLGLSVKTGARPANLTPIKPPRVGLFDRYGGMMPAGWTRYVLENFQVPYVNVYPQMIDAGNLNSKFDVLIFVDGAIPENNGGGGRGGRGGGGGGGGGADSTGGGGGRGGRGGAGGAGGVPIPAELQAQQGNLTERSIAQLKAFMEAGGKIVTIGSSAWLGRTLGLPIESHMVENGQPLGSSKFYAPGSVLRVAVDTTLGVAAGENRHTDVFFDNSPVFKLGADAKAKGLRPVAWYDSATPLRSGWAWGQNYLKDGVAIAEADVGRGTLYMFGPEILFRAQPHGTFKFLFNSIYSGSPIAQ